jgi:hypothetical protein
MGIFDNNQAEKLSFSCMDTTFFALSRILFAFLKYADAIGFDTK